MLIVLLIVTSMAASAPIAACVLVSAASVREDSACTLGEPATRRVQTWARRILDFHTDSPDCFPRRSGEHAGMRAGNQRQSPRNPSTAQTSMISSPAAKMPRPVPMMCTTPKAMS